MEMKTAAEQTIRHNPRYQFLIKLKYIFFFLLCGLFTACALLKPDVRQSEGFRGMEWHQPPSAFPELAPLYSRGQISAFVRPEEELRMGGAQLERIVYHFMDGRFTQVEILANGMLNFGEIKTELIASHGPPTRVEEAVNLYEWRLPTVTILLRYYNWTHEITLNYYARARS